MNNEEQDDILDVLFRAREEDLYIKTEKEKRKQKDLFDKSRKCSDELDIAIDNIPDGFSETIANIKKCMSNKLECESEISSYYNQKFYKSGFRDAIKLLL